MIEWTPYILERLLQSIVNCYGNDPEMCHSMMDDMIMEFLRNTGYGKAADVFEAADKWYA